MVPFPWIFSGSGTSLGERQAIQFVPCTSCSPEHRPRTEVRDLHNSTAHAEFYLTDVHRYQLFLDDCLKQGAQQGAQQEYEEKVEREVLSRGF